MISFDSIPASLRYPGAYIEVDASAAGLGGDLPAVLLVGQKLASGTAASGEIVQVTGAEHAKTLAGDGSMLAQMVARYRRCDPSFDVWILPYSDNPAGVAASGSVTVGGAPTASGTVALYIGNRLVSVGVSAGDTQANVATAIAAAITAAGADVPVVASAAAAVVTLSARHKGGCGNDIDLRLNLAGESLPAGLTLSLSAMAGGTGDPAPGDLESIIGQRWFRYVALGINDAATISAWHSESQRRYLPPIQAGFRAFAALRGDFLAASAFGSGKNCEHVSVLALGINPTSPWEAAAIVAGSAAPRLFNSPAQSLEATPLPGMSGVDYFTWSEANSLLFSGMSVMQVGRDGTCSVKRLISMYQYRPDGSSDDAYLDINTAELMERIRYEQRMEAVRRFTGSAAARSNEGYRPGLRITTVDDVRAMLLSLYQHSLMAEYGWTQNYDYYKAHLVVEQDPTNPSRFSYFDTPVLLSPFYILAGRSQFRKAV